MRKEYILTLLLAMLVLFTSGCEVNGCTPFAIRFTTYRFPSSSYEEFKTYPSPDAFAGHFVRIEETETEGRALLLMYAHSLRYAAGPKAGWQPYLDTLKLEHVYKYPERSSSAIDDTTLFPHLTPGDHITYYRKCGWGCAGGLVVHDSLGVKYIYDDSGYGRALDNDATAPFNVQFTPSACVNWKRRHPYLRIDTGQSLAFLLQGDRATVYSNNMAYRITALRVEEYINQNMTDAPSSYYSFVIERLGTDNFLR